MIRRIATVVAIVCMAVLGLASTANAVPIKNGYCDDGDLCFYWGSNHTGSVFDHCCTMADFGNPGEWFIGPGAGQGERVKNNAASVWNRTPCTLEVFYNEYWQGPSDVIGPWGAQNLVRTWNDNASYSFYGC